MSRRIALIGAGTGQAQLLRALRDAPVRVTAVVGVTDSGGHTGVLRRALGIPAVGDVRNCIAALAPRRSVWERLLTHRFEQGELDGTSVGNMLLATLACSVGSISRAAGALQDAFESRGAPVRARVLPVSDASAHVCAELASGRILAGEWTILTRKGRDPIRRVFHRPALRASAQVVRAVRQADLVVLCPGTLFTGVLSCAVASGLPEAIRAGRGRLVSVMNIMTQPGQTIGLAASDHLRAVVEALGRRPDVVLVNRGRALKEHLRIYARQGARPVLDDLDRAPGIVRADLVLRSRDDRLVRRGRAIPSLPHLIRHDPAKLRRLLLGLLRRPAAGRGRR